MILGGRWRLDDISGNVWLVRRDGWEGAVSLPEATEPIAADAAIGRLSTWFPEGWTGEAAHATLAEICLSLTGGFPGSGPPDASWLVRTVREALRDGRLVAVRGVLPPPIGAAGEEEEEAPAPRAAPREELTWIGIALVDDGDPPSPVPFKRYRVELPNGAVRQGMLDENGRARIAGIDPGTCQVTFPDFDERDWRRL
jgi:hypothetical protein